LAAYPETSFFRTKRGKIIGSILGVTAFGAVLLALFNYSKPATESLDASSGADMASKEALIDSEIDT
jgi:hypothetical protein